MLDFWNDMDQTGYVKGKGVVRECVTSSYSRVFSFIKFYILLYTAVNYLWHDQKYSKNTVFFAPDLRILYQERKMGGNVS